MLCHAWSEPEAAQAAQHAQDAHGPARFQAHLCQLLKAGFLQRCPLCDTAV